jgi:hypothetical protein
VRSVSELIDLNEAFAHAELWADVEFFRCYLADGLRFRRASGKVVDKATFLTDLVDPGNRNQRLAAREIEVLLYGEDLAVCSMIVDVKGSRGGTIVSNSFRNTRTFVRSEGVWKCAVWFNSVERE